MKVKSKRILTTLLSVGFATMLSAGVFSIKAYAESKVENVIAEFESEYQKNEEIAIPDAHFADGGKTIEANKTVTYPNGVSYNVDKFTPQEMGYYTIEYSAVSSEGKQFSEKKDIYVYDVLYEGSSQYQSVSYGAHELTPNTMGINVGLTQGGYFYYNKVIDLKALDGKPFITMYMTPEVIKEADGANFMIYLTDAYDSSNYLKIRVNNNSEVDTWRNGNCYIQAGAAFQPTTGYEKFWNTIHRESRFGFPQTFSFFGCDREGNASEEYLTSMEESGQLRLYLDLEDLILKTQGHNGYRDVIDFDNPEHFTDLWDGFTTGEVFLSIYGSSVSKDQMGMVITDIAGHDLTQNKYVDETAPFVTVNTLGYSELPNAVVGRPYSIFEGSAVDSDDGELSTDVRVYRNYGSPTQSNVSIVNGAFTPRIAGNYYIVYKAIDYSRNVQEVVKKVVCDASGEEIVIDVPTEGRVTQAYVGEYVPVLSGTATGGSGNPKVELTVKDGDGVELDIVDDKFKPLKSGSYTVIYTATDYVGMQQQYTYTVSVSTSQKPIFDGEITFPKYILTGYEYTMPEYLAFDYANGGKQVPVSITVTDDAGERTLAADRKITFNVANIGEMKTCKIKYTAASANGKTEKTYNVNVLNAKKMVSGKELVDLAKYFYTNNNMEIKANADAITISASENAMVEYVNPLVANGFSVEFNAIDLNSGLKLILEDEVDGGKRIEVMLSKNTNGKTNCSVNGGKAFEVGVAYVNGKFSFGYLDSGMKYTLDGATYTRLSTFTDGTAFEGFPSGRVRFYIEFVDVQSSATIAVSSINAQRMNENTAKDKVSPRITAYTTGSRIKKIGEVVTVNAVVAGDVISPVITSMVSVFTPTGEYMTSVDGIELKGVSATQSYQFKISQYGNYRIVYTAEDASGNDLNTTLTIAVNDMEAPVLTVNGENVSTVKKGSTVVFTSATVSDNYTPTEDVVLCCFVVRPTGVIFTINMEDSNSFIANEVGRYILRYMAMDKHGNVTFVENTLTVTE